MPKIQRHSTRRRGILLGLSLCSCIIGGLTAHAQTVGGERAESFRRRSLEAEASGLAGPFRGVTRDEKVVPDLFVIRSTGVSSEPVRAAASAFLSSLSAEQRGKTAFAVDDVEWRKWMNQHFYVREGVSFGEMTAAQSQAAVGLLRASLSAKGLQQSQDIMRLNTTLGELNGGNFAEYGEAHYYITMMGEPSADAPWGWQLDGHHLIINYFVLGDQVVMTPTFMGSEPTFAKGGRHQGTVVLQGEQSRGLAMINALDAQQREQAIIGSKGRANNLAEAFKDNLVLDVAGVRAGDMTGPQKERLMDLISEHVGNLKDGHAAVKMDEVRRHLDETHFAWIGGMQADSVFYYRIHSPVILIEFDHQGPIGLPGADSEKPVQAHIHSIVRTPNGNDYGKDLLRQHYERHPAPHRH